MIASMSSAPQSLMRNETAGEAWAKLQRQDRFGLALTMGNRMSLGSFSNGLSAKVVRVILIGVSSDWHLRV